MKKVQSHNKDQYIRNIGEIYFYDEIQDGANSRKCRKILKQLFEDFAKKCKKYFDITEDLPYKYREKQLHSILIPVIDNIADAILVEHPTSRKERGYEPSHGWIDYWIKYGDIVFLIELKHSYNGLKSTDFRKKSKEEWETAIKQLKKIPKKNIANFKIKDKDNVIKIALQFNTTYTTVKNNRFSIEECKNVGANIMESLTKPSIKPDFIAHWLVDKSMQQEYLCTKDTTEIYPYVHMLAKVIN